MSVYDSKVCKNKRRVSKYHSYKQCLQRTIIWDEVYYSLSFYYVFIEYNSEK